MAWTIGLNTIDQEASDFGKVTEPSLSEVQAAQSNVPNTGSSIFVYYVFIICQILLTELTDFFH